MHKFIIVIFALLLVLTALPGCGSSQPPTGPTGADEIAEGLIKAYDTNNYDAYLKYFNPAKDGAVDRLYFVQSSKLIIAGIGNYIPNSKVIKETKASGNVTDVYYNARYSKQSDVEVIVALSITDNGTYANGIWFNSPKLFITK